MEKEQIRANEEVAECARYVVNLESRAESLLDEVKDLIEECDEALNN